MAVTSTSSPIPAARKAAILLITLGEDISADIMQELSPDEVRRLAEETTQVQEISGDQTESVLREFYQLTVDSKQKRSGGLEFTQRLLTRAIGPDNARKLLAEAADPVAANFAKLEQSVKSDPARVSEFLSKEHPQTIALIVAHISAEHAVTLLSNLPPELRSDVALRLARLEQISPDVVQQIAEEIGARFGKQNGLKRSAYPGVRVVADLCNRLDPDLSQNVLQDLETSSPETAEKIRKLMFVFDDVLKLDDMAMSEINSRVDRKTLVLALKGTSDQLKDHFTRKMSSRAKDMLMEDLEALGPVKLRDVEAAQQEVIATIRQLEQEGVISSRGGDGGSSDSGYVS